MTTQLNSNELFNRAFEHHRAGRKTRAEPIYLQILAQDPFHHQSLYLLGVIALERENLDEAIELLSRATDAAPDMPAYKTNLGVALRRKGRCAEAVEVLRQAVYLKSDFPEAHYNLGLTLIDLGDIEAAHYSMESAVYLKPESFDMQRHFARLLAGRGEGHRAIGHYQCALLLEPKSTACMYELGNTLRQLRKPDAALALARRASATEPDSPRAYNEVGLSLLKCDQYDEAIATFETALAIDKSFLEAQSNLGIALSELGHGTRAIDHFRQVLASWPHAYAIQSNIIYLMPFFPEFDSSAVASEARLWNDMYGKLLTSEIPVHSNAKDVEKRLRVGYVSPHFNNHCQSFFTTPLLKHHDRTQVEVYCYANIGTHDEHTAQLQQHADVWRNVQPSDHAVVAELIQKDGIDILVDLTMHMDGVRLPLFARKPAPIQISWLAYPGTTGLDTIDYRITDPYLDPSDADFEQYTERSLVLPDTFWCYDPLSTEPEPSPLPAASNGYIRFGCLNHFRKLNDGVLQLWARVLGAVDRSKLLMLAPVGQTRAHIVEFFQSHGINGDRIEFSPRLPRDNYLRLYQLIDICLDTFPYGGHTTSLDSFWMGVPVVSLLGATLVGRACLTLASHLDLVDLVVTTPDDYVTMACNLTRDLEKLQAMRSGLRARMQASPLMDHSRFARNMEAAYREAWRLWCLGGSRETTPIRISSNK